MEAASVAWRGKRILPRKAVLELLRMLSPQREAVQITLAEQHMKVQTEKITFISKCIDGKYPDVHRLIPANNDKIVRLPKEDFKKALLRASLLCSDRVRGLRLSARPGQFFIAAHNAEQEEGQECISCDYDGAELDYAVNAAYLLDALNAIEDSEVELKLLDTNTAMLLLSPSAPKDLFLIMPMRI